MSESGWRPIGPTASYAPGPVMLLRGSPHGSSPAKLRPSCEYDGSVAIVDARRHCGVYVVHVGSARSCSSVTVSFDGPEMPARLKPTVVFVPRSDVTCGPSDE